MTGPHGKRPRKIRSFAQVPYSTPLVWQAAWLYEHAWRMAQHEHGDANAVDDALAVLALTTNLYHDARRDGVRQAVRAGATISEIAIALGMARDDTRDLVRRIEERDRELRTLVERSKPAAGGACL